MAPNLHAFSNSDWAGCYDTRVSTSGFCFLLGASCISWLNKEQPTVATSSCEAEYRGVFTAIIECVWLQRLLAGLTWLLGTTVLHYHLHRKSECTGSYEESTISCSH